VRTECLDWLLVLGRGHLEQVLQTYVQHYNAHRAHRALGLRPPEPAVRAALSADVWKFVGGQGTLGGRCSCQALGSAR